MAILQLQSASVFRPTLGSERAGSNKSGNAVLNSLTLTIEQGERVGILGRNGAGKTTLLRLLAGIFAPSHGIASVDSDTATILDSGFGVEPWLSGRENAASRLILTGVPRKERAEILRELETFLDLGPYFDEPTRTYSTGMLARLVFGMATVRQHAVLIVDEGFGTVDDQFQHAAWVRLNSVIGSTTTLVMASHNLNQLRKYCNRGIVLNKGQIIVDSDIETAIGTYVG